MSGINYYPLRGQDKAQRVINATANIAIASNESSSIYYCNNSTALYITIPIAVSNALPIGSQFDFIRANSNVIFNTAPGGLTITSSSGATPQIRVALGACSLIKVTSNTWVVVGDITT